MATWHSSVEGPRWAGIPAFLTDCAGEARVGLTWVIDKSLFRVAIAYTVTGTDEAVAKFRRLAQLGFDNYMRM